MLYGSEPLYNDLVVQLTSWRANDSFQCNICFSKHFLLNIFLLKLTFYMVLPTIIWDLTFYFTKKWIIPTIFQHFYLTIFSQLNIFFLWNICFHNIFIFRFNFFHIVQTATLAKTQHFPLCSSFNNVSLPFDNSTFFYATYIPSSFHYT